MRFNHRAVAESHVAQVAVRPDGDVIAELDLPFKDAADVDVHVAPADQRPAHVNARRVGQGDPGLHQGVGTLLLQSTLGSGQLGTVVDAFKLGSIGGAQSRHRTACGDGHGDHVGEVVLTFRVLVG